LGKRAAGRGRIQSGKINGVVKSAGFISRDFLFGFDCIAWVQYTLAIWVIHWRFVCQKTWLRGSRIPQHAQEFRKVSLSGNSWSGHDRKTLVRKNSCVWRAEFGADRARFLPVRDSQNGERHRGYRASGCVCQ